MHIPATVSDAAMWEPALHFCVHGQYRSRIRGESAPIPVLQKPPRQLVQGAVLSTSGSASVSRPGQYVRPEGCEWTAWVETP